MPTSIADCCTASCCAAVASTQYTNICVSCWMNSHCRRYVLFIACTHPLSILYPHRNVAGPRRWWGNLQLGRLVKAHRRAEALAALPDVAV